MTAAMKALVGAKWTPRSLPDVMAWWDGAHDGSFTFSSGTVVSEWRSRVGSYALGQATSGSRPSRSLTVNGRPAVSFDTSKWMSVASFDCTVAGRTLSLWAVFSAPSGSDRILAELSSNYNNFGGTWIAFRTSANNCNMGANLNTYVSWQSSGSLTTTPKAIVGTMNGTLAIDEVSGWLNGDGSGTRPKNSNSTISFVSNTLYVGSRAGSSVFLNGTICELGVVARVITTSERLQLQRYLSQKWGLGF